MNTKPNQQTELTLRDRFAMAALAGLIKADSSDPDMIASAAYVIADAMIEERAKK